MIRDFGFPVFCVLALGWVCWRQFDRMQLKLDRMETYLREELAEMVREAHARERELVGIIRSGPRHCPLTDKEDPIPTPHRHSDDADATQKILAAVHDRHAPKVHRGISGFP